MESLLKYAGEKQKLRVGAGVSVGTRLLDGVLTKSEEKMPDLDVRVMLHNTTTIEKMLGEAGWMWQLQRVLSVRKNQKKKKGKKRKKKWKKSARMEYVKSM